MEEVADVVEFDAAVVVTLTVSIVDGGKRAATISTGLSSTSSGSGKQIRTQ